MLDSHFSAPFDCDTSCRAVVAYSGRHESKHRLNSRDTLRDEAPGNDQLRTLDLQRAYWIGYEERHYPVILTPHHLKRLFEIEGLPIEAFTGEEPAYFSKAILLRHDMRMVGDLFDEVGEDVTPQDCWVKEVGPIP